MNDMPKHPRLIQRGNIYWHRAAIPADIKDTYPKTEEKFSLKTSDAREAIVRVRKAAAEVDARFAAHRRALAKASEPPLQELTDAQLAHMEQLYFQHLLAEDEEVRLDGFYDVDEDLPELPVLSFEEHAERADELGNDARYLLARGKGDAFFRSEAEEVLGWDGLGVKLAEGAASWKLAMRSLQAATVKAQAAITSRNEGEVVPTPMMQPVATPQRLDDGVLASVARKEWIAEKSRTQWVGKTKQDNELWTQHFLSFIGDKPITQYRKADARSFKRALEVLPKNWGQVRQLRGLTFTEAVQLAPSLGLEGLADSTINKAIGFNSAFWSWVEQNYDEVSANPFVGLKISIKTNARDERDVLTTDQLNAIFRAPIYTGCQSLRGWQNEGDTILDDSGRYWVPLISLYSGARLGEIIQLRVSDVRVDSGVPYFALVDEAEDQRLKTASSRRAIPMHEELIELGLLKLVERRKAVREERLFPELEMGNDGYYSSPFSKFFSRFLKSVGVKSKKTSFHSFRHTFEDACREADVPHELMNALQGHSEKGMSGRYGNGYTVAKLNEWMQRLNYPGLDLSHLKRG